MSLLVAVLLVTFMYSCTESEADQAQQQIEEAVEQTGEAIEEGLDNMEEGLRDVGEELDEEIDTENPPEILEED